MSQVELVPYQDFARLRLEHFVPPENGRHASIVPLENWEYMGGVWAGSALGFSEFLCLNTRPEELGSLALDAETLPREVLVAVLAALHLPASAGMNLAVIESVFGAPRMKESFVRDRVTYEYSLGNGEPYIVSFTVQEAAGLTYVTVIREDILALCHRDA